MGRLMDRRDFLAHAVRSGGAALVAAIAAACRSQQPQPSPVAVPANAIPSGSPQASPSSPSRSPSRRPSAEARNRLIVENRRPGDHGWELPLGGFAAIEAYVDAASVSPGDRLSLHASGSGPFDVEWYRLGWYGGTGGRRLRRDAAVAASPQRRPRPDLVTGLVEASWPATLGIEIGADWPSGQYVAVTRPRIGQPGLVPFTVREGAATERAPVLFVSATATWQAYNAWGGKSLYDTQSRGSTPATGKQRAAIVGYDRPYLLDRGAGYLRRHEIQFLRWQEREGRAVAYCADIDLEIHPEVADGRRLIVFVGHHEYWSRPMRERIERAVAEGTNVAFLSGNEVYWATRLGAADGRPGRRITCYKAADRDPLASTQPSLATCRWRESPLNDPEATLIGQMYGCIVARPADWIVTNPRHWLYEGTGVRIGDRFVNLVGGECDTYDAQFAPAGTEIIAEGPVLAVVRHPRGPGGSRAPAVHTATAYTADSGATVVAAGTFQWSWALDGYGVRTNNGALTPRDSRVARITRNLFDRLGDGPA